MTDLTTAILHALAATGRVTDPDKAQRIAREIATYGGLDRAVAALTNETAQVLLSDLLAYRAALAELVDPRLRIARLQQEADDLDARAEPLWAQAAQFAGRAAFRRLQGETELADIFQRKTNVSEQSAADLEAQAFAKRLEAAHLLAGRAACDEILKTIAA